MCTHPILVTNGLNLETNALGEITLVAKCIVLQLLIH